MSTPETASQPARRTSVPPLIVTQDNAFWFEGARAGRLLIQRCTECGTLRHPPGPSCPSCRSFAWDTVESAGRGTLHSWTVVHKPQDPAFTYPLVVGLLDLPEGTRIVADIAGIDADDLVLDMELQVVFTEHAHGELLPQLRPIEDEEETR